MGICIKNSGAVPAALLALALVLGGAVPSRAALIREYRFFTAELHTKEKRLALIALRRFRMNGSEHYLAVDPETLRTEIVPVGKYLILKKRLNDILGRRKGFAYSRAIRFAGQNSWRLQNAGITHIPGSDRDVYCTVDLCPTGLPLDRAMFNRLVRDYGPYHRPVPVALAVSGLWIEKHPGDLLWLCGLARRNDLAVTWVNHTYHHRYKKRAPLWKNFLLDVGSKLDEEVMRNEITMLESGLVPSVFFRFPGLVSNKALFNGVAGYGLIPLGSDAWLGKKQWPAGGSIILVHANGQEPVGIKRFLWILDSKRKEIAAGQWVFGDLHDGLRRAMKMY
ncbi:MAG: polysaccharide deacetylase [Spirochaetes bacterium]|nr:polysaccharide deacetylase [Spirochaetota bacterium]